MFAFVIVKLKRSVAGVLARPRYLEYCLVCSVVTFTVVVTATFVHSCVEAWYGLLTRAVSEMAAH
jgi:hypothetical protein